MPKPVNTQGILKNNPVNQKDLTLKSKKIKAQRTTRKKLKRKIIKKYDHISGHSEEFFGLNQIVNWK